MDMGCQLRLAAGEFPYGLEAFGAMRMRAFAFRNCTGQFALYGIAIISMRMRALTLRNLANQDAAFIITGTVVYMTGILLKAAALHLMLDIAGVGVLMPRVFLEGAGEHLALSVARVGVRMRFQFRQRADKGLPVVAVVVVHMRHRLRPLMGIGAVQHLPGIDLRHRRLAEAGKDPQRDDHRQTQNHGDPSAVCLLALFDPFQKRIHHDYILSFH